MEKSFYNHYSKVPLSEWRWPNFTPKEIACKGNGELVIDYEAMDCLQALRGILGPLKVNSAYRSEAHNKAIGGAKNSQHRLGKAFDIKLTHNVPREALKATAISVGFQGIGDYDNFLHLDTGPKRYWDFRKDDVHSE